eukprot:756475-Hanusia_phi.AAC.5
MGGRRSDVTGSGPRPGSNVPGCVPQCDAGIMAFVVCSDSVRDLLGYELTVSLSGGPARTTRDPGAPAPAGLSSTR